MLFNNIIGVFARPDFPEKLREHVVLSLVALLVAIAIALPVALLICNTRLGAAIAIPPILINASTGLREVNKDVIDAARGMGLSGSQMLARIQLPIAAPVIFAGIRTSAVQI